MKVYNLFGILFLVFFSMFIWGVYEGEEKVKIDKCYDRYNNEIVGQVCINEYVDLSDSTLIYFGLAFLFTIVSGVTHAIESGVLR